ncbi:thiol reductant ABC exporter subunit CydD [Marinospirillum sp. MEB164]|uniref:Thiol reductant ABC exporter subunit CydD n=1 Tax=Marinospirillum alkalitolerans TaxID=3123374 RepID=A0ABW8PT74_9GAMM
MHQVAIQNTDTPRQQLNLLRKMQAGRLNAAFLLAVAQLVVLILQYGLLAWLLGTWLEMGVTQGWQAGQRELLVQLMPWLALCLLMRPALQWGRERLSQEASLRVRSALRQQLLAHLAHPAQLGQQASSEGYLASQLLDQVEALDAYLRRYVVQAPLAVITPLLILLVIAPISGLAALLLALTAPLVPLFMVLLGKAAAASSRRQLQSLARLSGRFADFIRGLTSLQHLGATATAEQMIARSAEGYRQKTMSVLKLAFLSTGVLEFFAALSIALVAVYLGLGLLGILPWAKEVIPVPYAQALWILLLAPEFYGALRQLGSDYHAKADAEAAMTELMPLLRPTQWQHPGCQPYPPQPLQANPPALSWQQLRVVTEAGRTRLACPGPCHIESGQSLLVTGPSGVGKSTLLEVWLGALAYQGQLRVEGEDFLHWRLDDWLRQLDYLAQAPRFMAASLADNLRLACPDAEDSQLLDALEQVGLGAWMADRTDPLAVRLGEGGRGLSGGQLSRLALAQLLLRGRPLWLLDEPTAHLDPQSRREIHQLLHQLSRGRTLLLVSHHTEGLHWVDHLLDLGQQEEADASIHAITLA